ncbi:ATP phosphoribosyltransferase regulatory subunit [Clostridioides difficile]
MRDFTIDECKRRSRIITTITSIFKRWGYNEISTPTVEYYDTFNHKTQSLKEEEMYKFFDNNGRILVLRPDMTVPVARMINTKLKDMELPLKLFYSANVFRAHESLGGKRNEYLDCGIELIGADGDYIDLEVLVTALEILKSLDIKEKFKLEIGNVNILKSALDEMNLCDEDKKNVIELINKKSLINLEEYLEKIDISNKYKSFLTKLPWLFGGYEMISKAKEVAFNKDIERNILYLEKIFLNLRELGYEKYISVDMSMVPRVNYYSGIIFKGYLNGIGSTVLRGGRYNGLLENFGKDTSAIGFSVDVNLLIYSCDYEEEYQVNKIIVGKNNYLQQLDTAIKNTRNKESIKIEYI